MSFQRTISSDRFGKQRRLPLARDIAGEDLPKLRNHIPGMSNSQRHGKSEASSKGVKVSVLVPVFNGEHYLAECLDSILAQDFSDLEILVSDDVSTDSSLEIIKRFASRDARIRWWKNPRHLGLTANSNACLNEARGEYVKFVHQDDKLLSAGAIQKMVTLLDEHPGAVLVGSRQHLTGTDSLPAIFSDQSGFFNGRQMIVKCLERNTNLIGQPTLTLFRRLQAQRGFNESFTGLMDYEMWCYLLEQGDFAYIAEPLATWRVHKHQQTARAQGASDDEHLRFVQAYYARPWLRQLATDRMLFASIYYLRRKYGNEALPLISTMMAQLSLRLYYWEWSKQKVSGPLKKLSRKFHRYFEYLQVHFGAKLRRENTKGCQNGCELELNREH